MGWWLAPVYDYAMAETERVCLGPWRSALLEHAGGDVLEVGAGTGVNLPHYPDALERLVLAEPDSAMRKRLTERVRTHPGRTEVVDHVMEYLPYDEATFDVVVSTLVLCSVRDPRASLSEARRVLRPGGKLLFIEHVAAHDRPGRLRWQRWLEPVWSRLMGNCHLTRSTDETMLEVGFELRDCDRESMQKALPFVRSCVRGVAVKV